MTRREAGIVGLIAATVVLVTAVTVAVMHVSIRSDAPRFLNGDSQDPDQWKGGKRRSMGRR